ncbi:hypothetical protein EJ08DRAFT_662289 [Tothia fuscella]|uniref:Uncharacterized protein n=1 Tax=Tothia fuscella TaxID=1048955 RepID=A0A9P4NP35_9PEZI|nr:hypothetical protein EJ08DRAFT_662289 [Tothia fuscella]
MDGRTGRERREWDHSAVIRGLLQRTEFQQKFEELLAERYPIGVPGSGFSQQDTMLPLLIWEKSQTKDLMNSLQGRISFAAETPSLLYRLLDRAKPQWSFSDQQTFNSQPGIHEPPLLSPMRGDDIFDRLELEDEPLIVATNNLSESSFHLDSKHPIEPAMFYSTQDSLPQMPDPNAVLFDEWPSISVETDQNGFGFPFHLHSNAGAETMSFPSTISPKALLFVGHTERSCVNP